MVSEYALDVGSEPATIPVGSVLQATVTGQLPETDEQWDTLAHQAVGQQHTAGRFIPGLGHPVHKTVDLRTAVIIAIANQEGLRGPHLRLFEAVGRVHGEAIGRMLPLNGAGVAGAALADIGLSPELLRGVALLARAAGLLGHIAEELGHPLSAHSGEPEEITTGPDGTLWFTEFLSDQIGGLSLSGGITEYVIPTPESRPEGIVIGPDGTLWFTEVLGNKIGRIKP